MKRISNVPSAVSALCAPGVDSLVAITAPMTRTLRVKVSCAASECPMGMNVRGTGRRRIRARRRHGAIAGAIVMNARRGRL